MQAMGQSISISHVDKTTASQLDDAPQASTPRNRVPDHARRESPIMQMCTIGTHASPYIQWLFLQGRICTPLLEAFRDPFRLLAKTAASCPALAPGSPRLCMRPGPTTPHPPMPHHKQTQQPSTQASPRLCKKSPGGAATVRPFPRLQL